MAEHQYAQQPKKTDTTVKKQTTPTQTTPKMQLPSSHPMAIIQRARINPKSLTHADVMQLQRTIGNRAVGKLLTEIGLIPSETKQVQPVQMQTIPEEEKEPLQGKTVETIQRQEIPEEKEPLQGKMTATIQRQEVPEEEPLQSKRENNTGMPDNLKAGVESLSGIDMSDVRVHYNSSRPAEVGALAYTQGTNIHVAPGQEKHLPHEAWHVVQQAQGRVKPTVQLKDGVPVNDDTGLEHEADLMGGKVVNVMSQGHQVSYNVSYSDAIQCMMTPESEESPKSEESSKSEEYYYEGKPDQPYILGPVMTNLRTHLEKYMSIELYGIQPNAEQAKILSDGWVNFEQTFNELIEQEQNKELKFLFTRILKTTEKQSEMSPGRTIPQIIKFLKDNNGEVCNQSIGGGITEILDHFKQV